jgi:2-dehydropantoate 2-reductase
MTKGGFFPKRVAVVGAGPVGCVLAAHLANSGIEVTLCDVVKDLLAPAIDPGIKIEGAAEVTGQVARTITSIDDLAEDTPEVIFITVKATALGIISSAIEAFHKPGVCVISWQNGIDTELVLAEHIDPKWVFRAVVNFGVNLKAPGHVQMGFHHPPHFIQELDEESIDYTTGICELLTNAGLATKRSERLVDSVWQKAILNSALSPVCAATGKTMSQALLDPSLHEMVDELMKEGIAIARANEIQLGWNFYRYGMNYLMGAGDHKPSMLIDIENNRSTEVEFINGQIINYAGHAGLRAPYNRMIRAMVKALEP